MTFTSLHFTTHKYASRYAPIYPLYCTALRFTSLHFTSLHFTTHKYASRYAPIYPLYCTALHFTSPPISTLHGTPRFSPFTALHFTSFHFTSLHFTSLHFTSLHYILDNFNTLTFHGVELLDFFYVPPHTPLYFMFLRTRPYILCSSAHAPLFYVPPHTPLYFMFDLSKLPDGLYKLTFH